MAKAKRLLSTEEMRLRSWGARMRARRLDPVTRAVDQILERASDHGPWLPNGGPCYECAHCQWLADAAVRRLVKAARRRGVLEVASVLRDLGLASPLRIERVLGEVSARLARSDARLRATAQRVRRKLR